MLTQGIDPTAGSGGTNLRPDWIVVGAGFTGCVVAERIATQLNERVLIIERRSHVGGNAYDELDEHGLLVHRYGPHIFHTNAPRIWEYLSQFTAWRPYSHEVLGSIDDQLVPIPFNLNSLAALFPREGPRLERSLLRQFGEGARVPILELRKSADPEMKALADYVYEKVFLGYTVKQWDLRPEELDPSVTARVPVVVSRDNRYFNDRYQAMPRDGYSSMFLRMLAHPNIQILLGTSFSEIRESARCKGMVYTGPIDEYFAFVHGHLPYRSLHFDFSTFDEEYRQPVGTVNYPNQFEYTRITEQKHITGQKHARTTLVTEYPRRHVPGETEPYYPIPRAENRVLYDRYVDTAAEEGLDGQVFFAGRLADYRYYNMDQAVGRALALFDKLIVPLYSRTRSRSELTFGPRVET